MEAQNVEWKRQWDDKLLRQVCGFANSEGGVMKIGIDDDGRIIGVKNPKSDMKIITDTIADKLFIHPTVDVDETTNVITINVQKSSVPIDLDGKFYVRTGNTTHAVSGREYDLMVSRRLNISWSDMPLDGLDMSCLDGNAIDYFRKKAKIKEMISKESLDVPDRELLIKLKLMTRDGLLTRAAVLLFHPEPESVIFGSAVKIGLFEGVDGSEILYQDYVRGPLITMPDRLFDLISTKYSKKKITYEGLNMVETPPFPEKSLREAILNAVMHNDYGSGIPIQIRIWEDRMRIADSGGIPYNWTSEDLMENHESVPVNPSLANVFFLAGFVEGWGRGIKRMIDGYSEHPDRSPTFKVSHQSFAVVLKNINYDSIDSSSGKSSDVENSTVLLLRFLNTPDGRTSREIASLLNITSTNVATRKIKPLIECGLVERTMPDAISSKNQRYRITDVGMRLIRRCRLVNPSESHG